MATPMIEQALDALSEVAESKGALVERMRIIEILRDLSESGFIEYNQYEAMIMDICMGDGSEI